MEVIKGKKRISKRLISWGLRVLVLTFIFYIAFMLVNQYIQINNKKGNLEALNSQLELQDKKNEELRKIAQSTDEENEESFIRMARELNLSKPDERIFVNISGN